VAQIFVGQMAFLSPNQHCHITKETRSTDPNQWPGFILSMYMLFAGHDSQRLEASKHLLVVRQSCQDWWLWSCYDRHHCSNRGTSVFQLAFMSLFYIWVVLI